MYEVGELSMMIVSRRSRPTCDRSLVAVSSHIHLSSGKRKKEEKTDLDIISLVVITAVSEQAVVDNIVNVQLIKQRIAVLPNISSWYLNELRTF